MDNILFVNPKAIMFPKLPCPICGETCAPLDVVDFNKNCDELRGTFLDISGIPIYYFLCDECGFCFAPEFSQWTKEDFEEKIYNSDYVKIDSDWVDIRPRANAQALISMFGKRVLTKNHLDYGGGSGLLSKILRESGWQSRSYDPFVERDLHLDALGKFDLITAFEVFEHVPDVMNLISSLSSLLAPGGVVLFTTLLSDGNLTRHQRINWWYASPRNGHISLFSKTSLIILGAQEGFNFASFSGLLHAFWRNPVPSWAEHIIKVEGLTSAPARH